MPAARGRCQTQRETAVALWEARSEPQTWGEDGGATPIRPRRRVYLDRLEQGAYNAYAGGLLFAPLLARYDFLPTLSRVITRMTPEGYSLEELGLTLFYLDVFGFGSMEDFNPTSRIRPRKK